MKPDTPRTAEAVTAPAKAVAPKPIRRFRIARLPLAGRSVVAISVKTS